MVQVGVYQCVHGRGIVHSIRIYRHGWKGDWLVLPRCPTNARITRPIVSRRENSKQERLVDVRVARNVGRCLCLVYTYRRYHNRVVPPSIQKQRST